MEKVTLRELNELLHYKNLNSEVRIKIGDKVFNITSITESTKEGLLIVGEDISIK